MLKFNKYNILNIDFSDELNFNHSDLKFNCITDFIFNQIQYKSVFLFEMKPTNNSIIYDIDSECVNATINSKKVLYTKNIKLNKKTILEILKEDSFYLGHIVIVIKELNDELITSISNMWDGNLYETGLEVFKMGNDGKSFYWYNPQNEKSDDAFKKLFESFNSLNVN